VFVPDKPFQPSLMFVGKAGEYPSEASFRCSTLGWAPDLAHKHQTRLERLARDKHCSLLQKTVNYGCKKFYRIGPRGILKKASNCDKSDERVLFNC
jgi:hypothetical protein